MSLARTWLLAVAIACLAAGPAGAQKLRKLTFLPQWQPQAQFAGFFLAEDKGFYRARGLAVSVLTGGPNARPSEFLESGRADLGTMFLATAVSRAAAGAELVNVAQLVHRSSLLLVAKKSSGITGLSDLGMRKVSMWGGEFQIQPKALFQSRGIRVRPVPQATTVSLFLSDGVAAASAMWYNEYHLILNAGFNPDELVVFFLKDTEVDFPEDGIYCRRDFLDRNPELVRDFVLASLEGWRYAFDHPEEAVDAVMGRAIKAAVVTNRAHQAWMLARMQDIMEPDGPGTLSPALGPEEYRRVTGVMAEMGLLDDVPGYASFHRNVAGE